MSQIIEILGVGVTMQLRRDPHKRDSGSVRAMAHGTSYTK